MICRKNPTRGSDSELAYASPAPPSWVGVEYIEGVEQIEDLLDQAASYFRALKRALEPAGMSLDFWAWTDAKDDTVVTPTTKATLTKDSLQKLTDSHGVRDPRPRVIQRIKDILQSFEVKISKPPTFVGRRSVFNPELRPTYTCVVYCVGNDGEWFGAAKEILKFIREEEKLHDASVELLNPCCEQPRSTFPILKDDSIIDSWEKVRRSIFETIDLVDVLAIGCYRRGRTNNIDDTFPTVLVLVDPRSIKEWRRTREEIVDILNKYKCHMVAVEIVKDEIRSEGTTKGGTDRALLTGPAKVGHAISHSLNPDTSWSLGGFIELKVKEKWEVYALTCFHCVVPDISTEGTFYADPTPKIPDYVPPYLVSYLNDWLVKGVKLGDEVAQAQLRVDHPTLRAFKNQKKKLEDEMFKGFSGIQDESPIDSIEETGPVAKLNSSLPHHSDYRDASNFVDQIADCVEEHGQFLGHVAAGTGIGQIIENPNGEWFEHRNWRAHMEWAIIKLCPGRSGTNLKESANMLGYGTGTRTKGQFHPLPDFLLDRRQVDINLTGCRTADASSVVGVDGKHFSGPGDSGSWVFTDDKYVVGMVWCRASFNHITYYVPIEDIFWDILNKTDGQDVRIFEG
ncbi:hypothetical protein N7456_002973 [Penicillium angulare]|uniref:Uncharacterized protein n=1 Tax=Penicillium angulare TaxID=116970 RepID=A0A9W9FTW5_9EURO|nr:hypothetical protein N7456_002973 [Penicillium angulare]